MIFYNTYFQRMSCYESFCTFLSIIFCPIIWLWNIFFGYSNSANAQKQSSQNNLALNYQNHGLPNIGNTCYLNSVLQIIFASQQLRESIIDAAKRQGQRLVFHRLLANVFQDITKCLDSRKKRKDLQELISFLTMKNPEIVKFEQNDSYQCLLAILSILQQEDPRNSKLNFFKVCYESKCQCSNEWAYFEEYSIVIDQTCLQCKKEFELKIVKSGAYIILLPRKLFQLELQFKTDDKLSKAVYKIKGFITYFGNTKSGHYISKRRQKEVWLQINDGTVQNVGKICSNKTIPKIALYQNDDILTL